MEEGTEIIQKSNSMLYRSLITTKEIMTRKERVRLRRLVRETREEETTN